MKLAEFNLAVCAQRNLDEELLFAVKFYGSDLRAFCPSMCLYEKNGEHMVRQRMATKQQITLS